MGVREGAWVSGVLAAWAGLLAPTAEAGTLCLTPRVLHGQRGGEPFPEAVDRGAYRPTSAGFVDSATLPIRVHYRRESDAGRAQAVLADAEHSWRVEVEQMGWQAPPDDGDLGGDGRFDYYLTNEQTYGGAYTYGTGTDPDPGDGLYSLPSYVALDEGLLDAQMPVYVAHEFNHACQYAMDAWEATIFVWESTAQAMEDLVVDDSDLYYGDIADFNELPFASLLHDGYADAVTDYNAWSYYEYGGCIFGHFIEQRYGAWDGTALRDLWFGLAQDTTTAEPDFLDALVELFADGGDIGDVYLEFAGWRMFIAERDDGAHFEEGGQWPSRAQVALEAELDLDGALGATLSPEDPPYDLGTSYFAIAVGEGAPEALRLEATGEQGARWGLAVAAWRPSSPAEVVLSRAGGGTAFTAEVSLEGVTEVMVGVANLGPADLDAEQGQPERRGFELTVSEAEAPQSDPDPEEEEGDGDGEPEACASGCAAAGTGGGGGAAWALAGLAAGCLRRARSRNSG